MSESRRIEELEMKVAFQEQTISDLNETVANHTRDILRLEGDLEKVREALRRMAARVPASEDDDAPW